MGWYTDAKKKTGRFVKRHAGRVAREAAVVTAGIAGSFVPGCSVVCGVALAAATDQFLGDPIERSARRAVDKGGAAADDFLDSLHGGKPGPRPRGLATTVSGEILPTTIEGEYKSSEDDGDGVALAIILGASALVTSAVAITVLYRTGRLPWRT